MEKKRVTYGVFGMMEYQALVPIGSKTIMKINFSDGSLTAMGTNPARYSTDNYMVQHAIENSKDFRRGLICKISEVNVMGEVKIERNAAANDMAGASDGVNADAAIDVNEPAKAEEHESNEQAGAEREIIVHCNDDAKDYLEEHCGCVRSRIRTRNDINELAAANGIRFIFE